MDILRFVAVIAVVLGTITAVIAWFYWALKALEKHCVKKYSYDPITTGHLLLMILSCACFATAFMVGRLDNVIVAITLGAAVAVAVGIRIGRQTSPCVGTLNA